MHIITLSTKQDYPITFLSSKPLTIVGFDAFISIDFTKDAPRPAVTLVGFTVSAHPQEQELRIGGVQFTVSAHSRKQKQELHVGDQVLIGDTLYELRATQLKYIGNGDLTLEPVVTR